VAGNCNAIASIFGCFDVDICFLEDAAFDVVVVTNVSRTGDTEVAGAVPSCECFSSFSLVIGVS